MTYFHIVRPHTIIGAKPEVEISSKYNSNSSAPWTEFPIPWLNEAVRLLDEGTADVATIDAVAKTAFGIGMGPFHLMNANGIPIAMHAATTLEKPLEICTHLVPLLLLKFTQRTTGV